MGMANGRHRLTQIVDRSAHGHRLDVAGAGDRSVAARRRHAALLRWRRGYHRVDGQGSRQQWSGWSDCRGPYHVAVLQALARLSKCWRGGETRLAFALIEDHSR